MLELHESGIGTDAWFSYLPGVSEGPATPFAALLATAFTVLVGAVSFSGSVVTFLKLQEVMTTRPVILPGMQFLMIGVLSGSVVLAVWLIGAADLPVAVLLGVAGLLTGVLLVLPVGGADVPIVISLLNAFTGLTVAAGGYVLGNTLLLVAGTWWERPGPS